MRIFPLAALAAITLGVTLAESAPATAQAAATETHEKTLGYQDAQTGVFHPIAHVVPDATITPTTGKYEINFTVTVDSTLPKGATINCQVDLSEISEIVTGTTGGVVSYKEVGTTSVAAPSTGGKVTCSVVIPYSWLIPAATTTTKVMNEVSASYTVTAYAPASTTISESTITGIRSSSSTVPIPATLPTTGANTTAAVNVTL
jgi:hypothetical protein